MDKISRMLIAFAIVVLSPCVGSLAQTQHELNQNACSKLEQANAMLNKTYDQVRSEYRKDANLIRKLKVAQRAWIIFRDAQIDALYPEPGKRMAYGSAYPMCRCLALAQLTTQRADELRRWIDGTEEGEGCSGSIRVKN